MQGEAVYLSYLQSRYPNWQDVYRLTTGQFGSDHRAGARQ